MKSEVFNLYPNRKDVTLTTYLMAQSGEMAGQGKRPAVLICPGGAYLSCSDREGEPVALQFAAMGYHAFVLRYSTYSEGENTFLAPGSPVEDKPQCRHPNPVREIAMAMLLIRSHQEEWNVDMDRVAVCGFSAGAHNTAMYGVYWDDPLICDHLGVDPQDIRPAALILGYTLSDYIYMRDNTMDDPMAADMFRTSNTSFLGCAQPEEAQLLAVSPARLVKDSTPPTFLWATSADQLVPVQHSLRMAHALADHHIPFEMHIFEEGPHGLSVSTQVSALALSEINPDAAQWVGLAQKWLDKRFALRLPEKNFFELMMEAQQNQ